MPCLRRRLRTRTLIMKKLLKRIWLWYGLKRGYFNKLPYILKGEGKLITNIDVKDINELGIVVTGDIKEYAIFNKTITEEEALMIYEEGMVKYMQHHPPTYEPVFGCSACVFDAGVGFPLKHHEH